MGQQDSGQTPLIRLVPYRMSTYRTVLIGVTPYLASPQKAHIEKN